MTKTCQQVESQIEAVKNIIRKNKIMKESCDDKISLDNSKKAQDNGGRKAGTS